MLSAAQWLQSSLGNGTYVCKAMSNLSAYALIHSDPLVEPMRTVIACNNAAAEESVKDFLNSLGIASSVVPSLNYAAALEGRQKALLPNWQTPFLVMFVTWLLCHIYSFIRYNYYGGSSWENVTMWVSCCSGLHLSALSRKLVCHVHAAFV
jgi:hypothetical protein